MRWLGIAGIAGIALLASACAGVRVPTIPHDATLLAETLGACETPFAPSLLLRWFDSDGDRDTAEWLVVALLDEAGTLVAVVEGTFPSGGEWTMVRAHVRAGGAYHHYESKQKFLLAWPDACDLFFANQVPVKV